MLNVFCFTLLCDQSRKLSPPSKTMMFKTKINHNLVASIFLHFRQFGWFSVDVFLALKSILLSSDWAFIGW